MLLRAFVNTATDGSVRAAARTLNLDAKLVWRCLVGEYRLTPQVLRALRQWADHVPHRRALDYATLGRRHADFSLLAAALRELPDPDAGPYRPGQHRPGARMARIARRQERERAEREQSADTKKPARRPVDLIALLDDC